MQAEKLSVEIENLKKKRDLLTTKEGIRDSAMNLGYYVQGDTVYSFDSESLQDTIIDSSNAEDFKTYHPLSSISLILIAFVAAGLFTFIIWILSKNSNAIPDDDDEYDDFINDSDLYINA